MEENSELTIYSRPALRDPYVVCGINGWVNGGDVSLGGVRQFIRQMKAVKFAELASSRYHVYQVPGIDSVRPVFTMEDGLIVDVQFPKNQFYYALNPASDHDLIFFQGTEPSLYWEEYADSIIDLVREFGATRLYAFGGVLDNTPYTREPRMSCACTSGKVKDEMRKYNVTFSSREGPATINQMLLYACKKADLEGVNLTVRVPYYPDYNVAIGYSPKSIRAILVRLNAMMHLNITFDALDNAISELKGKLDAVRRQNPQFNAYIEDLEKDYVEMPYREPLDISAGEAIRFAEELLKQKKDEREGQ